MIGRPRRLAVSPPFPVPAPTWEFYRGFRNAIKNIKGEVGSQLAPSNAAFCGFLMTSLGDG